MMRRRVRIVAVAVLAGGLGAAVWRCRPPRPRQGARAIRGIVAGKDGPIAGAVVRVQATESRTVSAEDGTFALRGLAPGVAVTVTAWSPGHYIGWTKAAPGEHARITLERHYTTDNHLYNWFSAENALGSKSCGQCMPGHYAEWQGDAHSRAAVNPRFTSMYNGTDLLGNRSPRTRFGSHQDYGRFPLRPDRKKPYHGPGYKLDFPDTQGNCAACHAPIAAAKPGFAYSGDMNKLSRFEVEGVSCDFCHKIGSVVLDPATRLPHANRPGVLSMRLYRPQKGQQVFFGTFDDVTRRVTRLPLLEQSAFCAPCHYGVFWDVVVYNSYGEWLESPYSDPQTGKTCQDCHMPATKATRFVLAEKGGLERRPGRIFSHRMPGAADLNLLRDTARLDLQAKRKANRILVDVRVTNEKAGHHIPTDHPARNILLVVSATDAQGKELPHLGKQVVPDWGGVGDGPGDYAGRPGKGYAKILEELWTEISPTAAYWRQTVLRQDTRIRALAADQTHYEFQAPGAPGPVTVRAKLIYRRAFRSLARQKKWRVKDILMEREEAILRGG